MREKSEGFTLRGKELYIFEFAHYNSVGVSRFRSNFRTISPTVCYTSMRSLNSSRPKKRVSSAWVIVTPPY